jgi:hypothetical protein
MESRWRGCTFKNDLLRATGHMRLIRRAWKAKKKALAEALCRMKSL